MFGRQIWQNLSLHGTHVTFAPKYTDVFLSTEITIFSWFGETSCNIYVTCEHATWNMSFVMKDVVVHRDFNDSKGKQSYHFLA